MESILSVVTFVNETKEEGIQFKNSEQIINGYLDFQGEVLRKRDTILLQRRIIKRFTLIHIACIKDFFEPIPPLL